MMIWNYDKFDEIHQHMILALLQWLILMIFIFYAYYIIVRNIVAIAVTTIKAP